jgi:formylglycine-generating enzyme required for sulfatase activity
MPSTTTVGRYVLRAKLGAGAFGTVYRAYDPNLDREIALKILKSNLLAAPGVRERFQREARAAARLDHPHIVPVYDADTSGKHCYLASKLIAGKSLDNLIPENGLDPRRAVALLVQLLDALAHAHALGILHRDVKPANCLVDAQDRLYLTDFGLAGSLADESTRLTKEGAVMGTVAYMAPEQAQGQLDVGPAADQYSAGVALYELLTGQRPFAGPPQIVIYHAICTAAPPLSQFRPGLDATLETMCLTALTKRKEDRFADCRLFAEALRGWLARHAPRAASATVPVALPARPQAPTVSDKNPLAQDTILPALAAPTTILRPPAQRPSTGGKKARPWLVGAGMFLALVLAAGTLAGCLTLSALLFSSPRASTAPPPKPRPTDGKEKGNTDKPLDDKVIAGLPATMDKETGNTDKSTTNEPTDDKGKDNTDKPLDNKTIEELPATLVIDLGDGVKMEFVLLNAKGNDQFEMGASENDSNSSKDEKPRHKVTLTKPFYLGKYPVTQEQYAKLSRQQNGRVIIGDKPSYFQVGKNGEGKLGDIKDTSRFPVETVSWDEADAFCNTLTDKHGGQAPATLRQQKYRFALPTEAQWEYACRAGTSTVCYFGNDAKDLGEYAWFTENSGGRTHQVGTRKPNAWGLYDMHGNVWQWCQDYYNENYYANRDIKDPLNIINGSGRVLRGGSWSINAGRCRAAYRYGIAPALRNDIIGFRVSFRPD